MISQSTQTSQRILVADDNPVIRHMVTSILKSEGHTVVAVNDGLEAFHVLQRDADFKAAIFDMMMPHLEGLDVIRQMRTEKRLMRIPVIMITSENDLKLMKESFDAGVTVFLPKPFSPAQLQTMLHAVLAKNQGAAERRANG
jgi:two-component system chemotaxis response regulator CheY